MPTVERYRHKFRAEDVVETIPGSESVIYIQETPNHKRRMFSKVYPNWKALEEGTRSVKEDYLIEPMIVMKEELIRRKKS
jgi:hypothetical protein